MYKLFHRNLLKLANDSNIWYNIQFKPFFLESKQNSQRHKLLILFFREKVLFMNRFEIIKIKLLNEKENWSKNQFNFNSLIGFYSLIWILNVNTVETKTRQLKSFHFTHFSLSSFYYSFTVATKAHRNENNDQLKIKWIFRINEKRLNANYLPK